MQARARPHSIRAQRGVSLIITLVMLVIIGLTAAAAMRSAVSSEKVINNMRSEALAQQYAEVALRYCEKQMARASVDRPEKLQNDALFTVDVADPPKWAASSTWVGATALRTLVPEDEYKNADSSYVPGAAPQCFVEKQRLADGTSVATVITARGFSPDYRADGDGNTTAGSVVWLQSTATYN